MEGQKFDSDKVRLELIDPEFELSLAEVLTMGAKKYTTNGWQHVEDPKNRYYGALRRHLNAWRSSELLDSESGLPHLAHAACNIMFLQHFDRGESPSCKSKPIMTQKLKFYSQPLTQEYLQSKLSASPKRKWLVRTRYLKVLLAASFGLSWMLGTVLSSSIVLSLYFCLMLAGLFLRR